MATVGVDLKAARDRKGLSLRQAADSTRISYRHLQSLEDGRYADLPGGMYNRAFLRNYCEFLGLNATEMLARFEAEQAPVAEKPARTKPKTITVSPGESHSHPLLVWAVMLLCSAAGLYFSRHWIHSVFSPYFSKPAAYSADAGASSQPRVEPADTQVQAPAPAEPAPGGTLGGDPIVAAAAASGDTPPAGNAAGGIQLHIEAVEDCWVSVRTDGAPEPALARILRPGESRTLLADERMVIVLGNAGGVRIKINGRDAKPAGKSGEVVTIVMDQQTIPDLLQASTN